ncbi:MAG: hypothetical protein V5A36_06155, partial [Natronomonas sp.]
MGNKNFGSKNLSRRKFALASVGGVTLGLAGCGGGGSSANSNGTGDDERDPDSEQRTAVASFFTFYDFAR